MSNLDHRDFRATLGTFATGITVVTMTVPRSPDSPSSEMDPFYPDRETFGITVNAFMSVSLEPPLVAVSIERHARANATLHEAERFGISVLAAGQAELSDQFAGRPVAGPARPFEELDGFPVLRGAIAQLVVSRHAAFEAGDHTIFVGRVEALKHVEGDPLIYFRSAYHRLPQLARPR